MSHTREVHKSVTEIAKCTYGVGDLSHVLRVAVDDDVLYHNRVEHRLCRARLDSFRVNHRVESRGGRIDDQNRSRRIGRRSLRVDLLAIRSER